MGTLGNESADALAKAMAISRPSAPAMPKDRMELINISKNQKMKEWQLLWETRTQRWSFQWKNKVNKYMRLENFNNEDTELLNNFFAGSSAFNDKMHLWGLKPSPNCDADPGFRETPRHFLFSCSNTRNMRESLREIIKSENGNRCLTFKAIWKSDQCLRQLAQELKNRFQ